MPARTGAVGTVATRSDPSLARLIRRSRALDGVARRHWLAVLPHLTADDRARLREILRDDSTADPRPDAPPELERFGA